MSYFNMRGVGGFEGSPSGGRYDSGLECDGFIGFMLDPDVLEARLQQPRIHFEFQGRKRRYTADLLVLYVDHKRRPLVVEFKPAQKLLDDPELGEKHDRLKQEFDQRGLDFGVRTDGDVYTLEFVEKEFIFRYFNSPTHPLDEVLTATVRTRGAIAVAELIGLLCADPLEQLALLPAVWRLVARKEVYLDFRKKIGRQTLLCAAPVTGEEGNR